MKERGWSVGWTVGWPVGSLGRKRGVDGDEQVEQGCPVGWPLGYDSFVF